MKKSTDKYSVGNKPVDLSIVIPEAEDCFGKEWGITDKTCVSCSLYDVCMVLCLQTKKPKKTYFDELNWDAVNWEALLEHIEEFPGVITLEELRATVKTLSKCLDETTVKLKVQHWLIANNIKIEEGCLYLS